MGYWKLNETNGSTASDSSGMGYNGTVNNATWTTGRFDGGLGFDGSTSYVSVPYLNSTDATLEYTGNNLTLGAWVYVNPTETTGGYLISKDWNSSQNNYRLSLGADRRVSFSLGGTTTATITSTTALSVSTWHYVAATADAAGNMTLYIDKQIAAAGTYSINWGVTDNSVPLTIGGSSTGGTAQCFDGKLDDVRIWESVLSPADIQALTINAPPAVNITAPAADYVFNSPTNVTITANASDSDGSVTQVAFYENGIPLGTDTNGADGWSWLWNSPAPGQYAITAVATDNEGAQTTSAAVNITVNDVPSCSITAPVDGHVYQGLSAITFTASVTNNSVGTSGTTVAYYLDGSPTALGTGSDSNFTFVWSSPTTHAHTLTAVATDYYGAVSSASTINFTVNALPSVTFCPINNVAFVATDASTPITLSATASDADGTITGVTFYQNGTNPLPGTLSGGVWSCTWNVPAWSFGTYSITAVATDNNGGQTTSSPFSLTLCGQPTNQAVDVGQTATLAVASPIGSGSCPAISGRNMFPAVGRTSPGRPVRTTPRPRRHRATTARSIASPSPTAEPRPTVTP